MRTAKLDEIVRQTDPAEAGRRRSRSRARVKPFGAPTPRPCMKFQIDTSASTPSLETTPTAPGRPLVVAPDNQSRRELNDHIRHELKDRGVVGRNDHQASVFLVRT